MRILARTLTIVVVPLGLVLSTALPAAAATTWTTANSVASGDQDGACVATNRTGYVAVAWEDDRDTTNAADNVHSEIYLRLYRDGTSLYEIRLSAGGTAGTSWKNIDPDVGLDDRGNAVVVWSDDPDGNGAFNVPYRVVSPTGSILASGRANASAAGQQVAPKVAVDPDGTPTVAGAVAFTVVWEDIQGTAPATIRAAGYTNVATKAYEVTVSPAGGGYHRPVVGVSAAGDAVVVWDSDGDGNGFYNVALTRLARNGTVSLSLRTANANTGGQQRGAAVAVNVAGDFAVTWESDHTGSPGIWTRSFTADGAPRHSEAPVSPGAGTAPTIGIDDQACTVVAWTAQGAAADTWVRGFNPDGTVAGRLPAQLGSQVATGRQEEIVVAVSPWAEVAVAYTDDNDGNTFDQVILGLGMANTTW